VPFIERAGTKIFYERRGRSGDTIVLLHNTFCDHRVFEGVAERLRKSFRLILVDFRGHGQSPMPAKYYTAEDLAVDVVSILNEERVEKALIVGVSIGATVALELALGVPGRLAGIALLGATARPNEGRDAARNSALAPLVRIFGVRGPILALGMRTLFGGTFRDRSRREKEARQAFAYWRGRIGGMSAKAAYASLRAWCRRPSYLGRLSGVTLPALVVAGEEDVACRLDEGAELARSMPRARLVRVPAGHMMAVEKPGDIAEALEEFAGSADFGR